MYIVDIWIVDFAIIFIFLKIIQKIKKMNCYIIKEHLQNKNPAPIQIY